MSFSYLLEPVVHLSTFRELFLDDSALGSIQVEVQKLLIAALSFPDAGPADSNWICEGTKDWSDFSNFTFTEEGILITFASYQVASYSAGMPTVKVPYQNISRYLVDNVLHALGLHRPKC
jgi:hypothetical protein